MKSDSQKAKSEGKAPVSWTAVILAAGKGTRMGSPLPKVLHPVAGKPMLQTVIESCRRAGIHDIRVVTGHGAALVKSVVEPMGVQIHTQLQQLGTADAVKAAQPETIDGNVLILNGDHPLIESGDLTSFMEQFETGRMDLAVVTARLKQPKDFGRIVRNQGRLVTIVEARDASSETLKIDEVNTGIYAVTSQVLREYLPRIRNHNAKKEFYLTDLIGLAIEGDEKVGTLEGSAKVAMGVNTQGELARASRIVYLRNAKKLMESGVLILDPKTVYVEDSVEIAPGTVLYPGVFLRGKTRVGTLSSIEPNCFIVDSLIGEGVQIRANSYLERAQVLDRASVGPFARLRPETVIGEEAHVGNFVEMKKVKFGAKSKAGHLTYLGDAEIGSEVNIGCGTITCNYAVDRGKYKTVIGNNVFVGSDTQFVAPVSIGDGAVIGSGSTITKDVPARALAVARGRQVVKENYVKSEEPTQAAASPEKAGE